MDFPNILQIEPTNTCNFSCIMCMRNFWDANLGFMDVDLYKKIINEASDNAKRVVLYGMGEPLHHPGFIEMVRLAREKLNQESEIFFSTNGSLLKPNIADKLVINIGVDSISVSVDTSDFAKLEKIRVGAMAKQIFETLKYLSKIKEKAKRDFKLGVEAVIMKSNLADLPTLTRNLGELGIDYLTVSHIIPYNQIIGKEIVYFTYSKEAYQIAKEIADLGWSFIRDSIYETFRLTYGDYGGFNSLAKMNEIMARAKDLGIEVNFPLIIDYKELRPLIKEVERVFEESKKIASSYGMKIDLPAIFLSSKNRHCPYIDKNAMVIRHDGKVAPCFNFMYTHTLYINKHMRTEKEVIFGDLNYQSIREVWNSPEYTSFRGYLRDINRHVPWCGDCPYSSLECWFTRSNEMDCYGNKPSCSECLYSVDIAKCLI